ncbi:hypothetical protein Tco_0756280, partial [Tanacetum coccineum]
DSPAPKPAKPAKQTKPKLTKQSKPTEPKAASKKPKPASAKPQEKKRKPVSESLEAPPLAKRAKAGKVVKKRTVKSSKQLVDEFVDEGVPAAKPSLEDTEEAILEKVPGKGKEKVVEEQAAQVLLHLQTTKKKSPTEQYIFQRHTPVPSEPAGHEESSSLYAKLGLYGSDTESDEEMPSVVRSGAQDESQAGPNPDDVAESQPLPTPSVLAGPNLEHSDVEITDPSSQPQPEHMDEGFTAAAYPDVQENLKLTVDEQVIPEEPVSSTGTLSITPRVLGQCTTNTPRILIPLRPILGVLQHGSDEGSLKLIELMNLVTKLSERIGVLEDALKRTKQTYSASFTKLILKIKKLESKGEVDEDPNTYFHQDDEVDDDVVHDTAEERQPEDSTAGIEISTAPINDNTASESLSTAGKETRKFKGKVIMTELEPEKKSKKLLEQERLGLEEAIRLQEQERGRNIFLEEEKKCAKKQKVEQDDEKEELKNYLDIVPREDVVVDIESLSTKYPIVDWNTYTLSENFMYYKIIRGDGSSKNYKILSEMLYDFDRQDVVELYRLVKEMYSSLKP